MLHAAFAELLCATSPVTLVLLSVVLHMLLDKDSRMMDSCLECKLRESLSMTPQEINREGQGSELSSIHASDNSQCQHDTHSLYYRAEHASFDASSSRLCVYMCSQNMCWYQQQDMVHHGHVNLTCHGFGLQFLKVLSHGYTAQIDT